MNNMLPTQNNAPTNTPSVSNSPLIRRLEYIPPLPSPNKKKNYILNAYLIGVIICNFLSIFFNSHGGDLGYWEDWIKQLAARGYDNFNGNYPPVYIHWLYIVGKFYAFIGMPVENNDFLKFVTQLPVMLCHCLLTIVIFNLAKTKNHSSPWLHAIMAMTAFNPAILINGPMWGQVDLIPSTLLLCSLILAANPKQQIYAIPLFALALLTKFQMIAFAPIFGFLFFRNPIVNILGINISIITAIIIFLPSILAGHLWQAFKQAYIDTLGQYPLTTFNAANLWILLTGNTAPDSQLLFGVNPNSSYATLFIAKYFGMALFSITSLWVFFQGLYKIRGYQFRNTEQLTREILFYAMLCAIAFFTLLPAMHERYSFPAVIMALAYAATAKEKWGYPLAISLASALNMLIILNISGSDIWLGLSVFTVAVCAYGLLESIFNGKLTHVTRLILTKFFSIPLIPIIFLIATTPTMFWYFYNRYQIHEVRMNNNQVPLTHLELVHAQQDHRSLQINRSYDEKILSIGNRRYAQGIGTHANSNIQYRLPYNAETFSFKVGLDDEVGTADVQFSVWGDNKLLWESPIILGNEKSHETYIINVKGIKILSLKVNAINEDKWDHADWINTVITTTP